MWEFEWKKFKKDNKIKNSKPKKTKINSVNHLSVGSKNYGAKLKEEDVINIRKLFKDKIKSMIELSEEYNVSQSQINRIVTNRAWRHI